MLNSIDRVRATAFLSAAVLCATCSDAIPAAHAGPPKQPPRYHFFTGLGKGDDLQGLVWLAMGNDRSFGVFGALFQTVVMRLAGPDRRRGSLQLDAIYPLNNKVIGHFNATVKEGKLSGKWSAAGRNGKWHVAEVPRDSAAMQSLAGSYVMDGHINHIRKVQLDLDAVTEVATLTVTRAHATVMLSGPWMVGTGGELCLLPLKGDGTIDDLLPLGLSVAKVPIIIGYRTTSAGFDLLNPINPNNALLKLERQTPP